MHYHIYCKEKKVNRNYHAAYAEFQKRLSAYCDAAFHPCTVLTLPRELHFHHQHFLFLQSGSSTYSSEEFAQYLNVLQHSGKSTVHVIIGFTEAEFYSTLPDGQMPENVDYLSLTKISLPPKTLSLLFFEQLYRGYTILQGKTYHK